MFRKTSLVVSAAAAILFALSTFSTARTLHAAPPTHHTAVPVYSYTDGKVVPGAKLYLRADAAGVTVGFYTSGLPVGSEAELWWFVYNAPEQCVAGMEGARCGLADLWNKAAQPSAFYGASQKIGGDLPEYVQEFPPLVVQLYEANQPTAGGGSAYFLDRRTASERKLSLETSGAPYKDVDVTWRSGLPQKGVVIGSGITNPLGAEIHLILVSCVEGQGPAAGTPSARRSCENTQYAVHQQ